MISNSTRSAKPHSQVNAFLAHSCIETMKLRILVIHVEDIGYTGEDTQTVNLCTNQTDSKGET